MSEYFPVVQVRCAFRGERRAAGSKVYLVGEVVDVDGNSVVFLGSSRERADHVDSDVGPWSVRSFLRSKRSLGVFGWLIPLASITTLDIARDVRVHSWPLVVARDEFNSAVLSEMSSSWSVMTGFDNPGAELCILGDVKLALVIN